MTAHAGPGEYRIRSIVAVWQEDEVIDPNGKLHVLPRCGYCRQFMRDINEDNLETDVVLDRQSSACLATAGGLRPDSSQPTAVAATGTTAIVIASSTTGTWPEKPPPTCR